MSVIILTCNRWPKLEHCLNRLLPQLQPGDEAVILDTGSTDGTRERLRRHASPFIRTVLWDETGSFAEARNAGVSAARNPLLAFLDDDCLPDHDWVAIGREGLADADALGGIVRPLAINNWPAWWHADMGWMVGLSVPGHVGPDAGRVYYPFTANLWARRAACVERPFQQLGGSFGQIESDRYIAGREDASWWRGMRIAGYRCRFDSSLGVCHDFHPGRLDLDYMRRRAEMDGRAWARREGHKGDLPYLAYAVWAARMRRTAAFFSGSPTRTPEIHLNRLNALRNRCAISALQASLRESKTSSMPTPLLMTQQFLNLSRDRIKDLTRRSTLGWWRSKPRNRLGTPPYEIVAIFAFGFLGDLVLLQSALRGLLDDPPPGLTIHIFGPPIARRILGGLPRVEVTTPPEDIKSRKERLRWLERWLDELSPGVVFAPYLHGDWGPIVAGLRQPRVPIIGFDQDHGLPRKRMAERISIRIHKDFQRHEVENLCSLFSLAGMHGEASPALLKPLPRALNRINGDPWFLDNENNERPIVMLNPDAAKPFKEWPDEKWNALISKLLNETSLRMVLNDSRERAIGASQAVANDDRIRHLAGVPLEDLIAWLSLCEALVTVDAGPQHLAHALDVRTLTLYGPMDERRWADFFVRTRHRTIRACTSDLTPDEKRHLPINHEVALIEVDDVFDQLVEMLETPATS